MSPTPTDCYAHPGEELLAVEQARTRILRAVQPVTTVEQLDLRSALGRVLARAVVANIDVPPFANSAMDGYAVRSQDLADASASVLEVIGASFAGRPYNGKVSANQCVRIMTGAVLPEGADAVIMQERVKRTEDRIALSGDPVRCGQNVRYAGEDNRRGDTVLAPNTKLGAAEIGLLASVGVNEVPVSRRLRVAFFSTGDELTAVGAPLSKGQIYDSNRYTLFGLLSKLGVECYDLGVVGDQRAAVRAAFLEAGDIADLILTSGGVSVGEADFVTETLEELGEINFWRMAMKPGKPLAFGRMGNAMFFGLPGNPVSVMVTFYQFVLPAIRKMSGEKERDPMLLQARSAQDLKKTPGRMEFQRGILTREDDGSWRVTSSGMQGSHLLSSMSKSNCLILLPADSAGAEKGEWVTVQPFLDFA